MSRLSYDRYCISLRVTIIRHLVKPVDTVFVYIIAEYGTFTVGSALSGFESGGGQSGESNFGLEPLLL